MEIYGSAGSQQSNKLTYQNITDYIQWSDQRKPLKKSLKINSSLICVETLLPNENPIFLEFLIYPPVVQGLEEPLHYEPPWWTAHPPLAPGEP